MKKLALLLVLISLFVDSSSGKGCKCAPVATGETTRWGGNEAVVIKPGGTYEFISGKVLMSSNEEPMDGALVEVFNKADYLFCKLKAGNPKKCMDDPPAERRRIAACVTSKDGKFCFDNIPAGKYEIRVSKNSGWDVSQALIVINPESRWSKRGGLTISMFPGE